MDDVPVGSEKSEQQDPPLSIFEPHTNVSYESSEQEDYTALLKQIPGFEGYAYHSSNNSGSEEARKRRDSHSRRNLNNSFSWGSGRRPTRPFPTFLPSDILSNLSGNALAAILPLLKDANKKWELVIDITAKSETCNRRLARNHMMVAQQFQGADRLGTGGHINRSEFCHYQHKLRVLHEELAAEHNEAVNLHKQLITAQDEALKVQRQIYACLTGGASLNESEAYSEDLLLFQQLALGHSLSDQANSNDAAQEIVEVNQGLQWLTHAIELRPDSAGGSTSSSSLLPGSAPIDGLYSTSFDSMHHQPPETSTEEVQLQTARSKPHRSSLKSNRYPSSSPLDLLGCGHVISEIDTSVHIAAAQNDSLLSCTMTLKMMRQSDLKSELHYYLSSMDSRLEFALSHPSRSHSRPLGHGFASRLASIEGGIPHASDFIKVWLYLMSHNAPLESSRTFSYGNLADPPRLEYFVETTRQLMMFPEKFDPPGRPGQRYRRNTAVYSEGKYSEADYSVDVQPSLKVG